MSTSSPNPNAKVSLLDQYRVQFGASKTNVANKSDFNNPPSKKPSLLDQYRANLTKTKSSETKQHNREKTSAGTPLTGGLWSKPSGLGLVLSRKMRCSDRKKLERCLSGLSCTVSDVQDELIIGN